MVAKEIDFDLQGFLFTIEGRTDLRGRRGDPDVRVYFEKIAIHAAVRTSEPNDTLQELKGTTNQRCPVFMMLQAAAYR
jgi:putative redox protein